MKNKNLKYDCQLCNRFYECDNSALYEECLPLQKYYEGASSDELADADKESQRKRKNLKY